MCDIKILNRKNHPFTHKIKIYGVSIEVILIASFAFVVLFLAGVYIKQKYKRKPAINRSHHSAIK